MPYCGRPSTGCLHCKNRRIKCDETRPQCNNCRRTNRKCPGFPQQADLVFRDEAPNIRKRAKRKETSTSVHSAQDEAGEDPDVPNNKPFPRDATKTVNTDALVIRLHSHSSASNTSHPSLNQRLNPPIEQQATVFFFKNFLLPPRSMDSTRGMLDVAAPLYHLSEENSPVKLAVQAVAMAIIACWPGRQHLAQLAARLYSKALIAAQRALESFDEATADGTLSAVLLFQMYETMSSSNSSVTAWGKHTEGAVAIVKARGVRQFENEQSLKLFRAVRTQMLLTTIQTGKPVSDFPGPQGWLSDFEGEADSETCKLLQLAIDLPNLVSDAKLTLARQPSPASKLAVGDLLRRALDIQTRFLSFESHLPPQWSPTTTAFTSYTPDPTTIATVDAWPGPIHSYTDVHISSIRNNNRVNQILCSCVIVDALKYLDPEGFEKDERCKFAAARVQTLADEVCYSVPFHLWGQDVGVRVVRAEGGNRAAAEGMGAYLLVWPLYSCSTIELVPEVQRRWMRGRLKALAKDKGIELATVLGAEQGSLDW